MSALVLPATPPSLPPLASIRTTNDITRACVSFAPFRNWTEQHVKYCHRHKDKYKFQTSIVRPALITSCAKDPYPGYISNNAGPAGMAMAFAHGLLSYSVYKPDRVIDMIPGDFVANTIILGCAAMKEDPLPSPRILHSSSSVSNPVTIRKYFSLVMDYFDKEPVNQEILRNLFG